MKTLKSKSSKKTCPFLKTECCESNCGLWVELVSNGESVGKCSYAWSTIVNVELRLEIEKIRLLFSEKK